MTLRQGQKLDRLKTLGGTGAVLGLLLFVGGCSQEQSGAVSRSIDVQAAPAAVWEAIGPFCSISDWHPVVGTCEEDGNTPPTRTLVTADGAATFVELQTDRDDAAQTYSYTILSGPLPISDYVATISVEENASGGSTVQWSGVYTPDEGADEGAAEALTGIYDAGLGSIAASFAQ